MFCLAGGIGGGGLLVPIYIMILEFGPKYAIPLSSVTILVCAWKFTNFDLIDPRKVLPCMIDSPHHDRAKE